VRFADDRGGTQPPTTGSSRYTGCWQYQVGGQPAGQTVSALRHLTQLADLPILLAWGSDDKTIPPAHHRTAVELLGSPPFIEIVGTVTIHM